MEEPWLIEEKLQRANWRWLDRRPKCLDCGEAITEDYALRAEGGLICEECRKRRMTEVPA